MIHIPRLPTLANDGKSPQKIQLQSGEIGKMHRRQANALGQARPVLSADCQSLGQALCSGAMHNPNCIRITLALVILAFAGPGQAEPLSPRDPGAPWPVWELVDFQPKSPKYNQTYGLNEFRGRVTLVALLATWCPYCQRQVAKMEELKKDLESDRVRVNFVAVNIQSGEGDQHEFTSRCSFPLFQDTEEVNAFKLHRGRKDDYFIYNERGELTDYFPYLGDRKSDLTSSEGYENIKQAILKAPYKTKLVAETVIKLTIKGVQGRTYRVQYSEDLGPDKKWRTLKKITLLTDRAEIVDTTATPLRKRRFYRTEELP